MKVTKKMIKQAQAKEIKVLRRYFNREALRIPPEHSMKDRMLAIKQAEYALDVLESINDDEWEPCLTSEELMKTFVTKETV